MRLDRRTFLVGSGALAVSLAGCSDGETSQSSEVAGNSELAAADLDLLEFVASLEALAVETYESSIESAGAGKLGEVPPAGAEFLQVAHDQHQETLEMLNGVLEANQRNPVTEPSTAVRESMIEPGLGTATGFPSVAGVVRNLEAGLAATYLKAAQSELQSRSLIRTAAGVQATAQKRVAVLSFMIGEFPSPDPFQKTDAAFSR